MYERVKHMLIKEFLEIVRDRKMLRSIFLMPLVQVVMFGYAVTTDVTHIATAVYDLDHSVASREVVARFERSGYFDVIAYVRDAKHARELVDRGDVQAVLHMQRGFGEALGAGRTAQLQIIVDGTDANTARITLDYSTRLVEQFSQQVLIDRVARLQGLPQRAGRVALETRAWFNENLESRNFYVPGVIALIVMNLTLILTSMAVVREKEIGTMEQILVTPITPAEFILGKTVPFALIGLADVILITLVGVLISTVSQTQQQAMLSAFFFFSPAILLSGFIFPIANMPEVVQWLTYLNPLRYFLVIIRGIFLKGVGLGILWPQMLALAVIGLITLWLASRRFRKTLA
jgi:ABC-2 type transport system permease protein